MVVMPRRDRGALSMLKSPSLSLALCEVSFRPEVALLVLAPRSLSDSLPEPGPEKGDPNSDLMWPAPVVDTEDPRVTGKGRVARVTIGEGGSTDC